MTKGGSERKKEVAGAEEKHNSPGEVLAEGQRAPVSLAGCGNLRHVPAEGCGGMEELGLPYVPTPQLQESPGSNALGWGKKQSPIKAVVGEGPGCCRVPGAAV